MDKKEYLVRNRGCDDTTYCVIELTQEEFDFLNKFFDKINENSSYGCQPTIHFDLERKFEKIEGDYTNEFDYKEKTEDYCSDVKKLNGILYKLEW